MATSRINDTNTGQYNQVVAVSQDMVNFAMGDIYDAYPETQKIDMVSRRAGSIQGDLNVPGVRFNVKGTNLSSVIFQLRFASGSMLIYSDNNDDGKTYDIANWKFGFSVNMDLSQASEEIRKQLEIPGDYSAQRLYLDFTTARINDFSMADSDFNGLNWDSAEELPYRGGFLYLMTSWLSKYTDGKLNTIGVTITVPSPQKANPVAPSFPPTALQFQTYPYQTNGPSSIVEGYDGAAGRNCLCYLEMTLGRPLPATSTLAYSGNWVTTGTKDTQINGSICLGKQIFFVDFVNPLLQQYCHDMLLCPTSATVSRDGWAGFREFKWSFNYSMGSCTPHPLWTDSWYSFVENPVGCNLLARKDNYSNTPNTWLQYGQDQGWDVGASASGASWTFNQYQNLDSNKIDESSPGWPDWLQTHVNTNSTITVIAVPGTNTFKIRGLAEMHVLFEGQYRAGDPGEYKGAYDAMYWWGVDFTLGSITNGVLECTLKDITPHSKFVKSEKNVEQIDAWFEKMTQSLPKYFEDKQHVSQSISESLKTQGRFVFPGGGYFTMKDPAYNNNGDLLVTTAYNALIPGMDQSQAIRFEAPKHIPQQPVVPTEAPETFTVSLSAVVEGGSEKKPVKTVRD